MNGSFRRVLPTLLLLVMAVALFTIKRCKSGGDSPAPPRPTTTTTTTRDVKEKDNPDPAANVNRDHGFDRRTGLLKYSKHARCRMDCRHITETEVEQIMQVGKINYKKSDLQNALCPRYAVEGVTNEKQDLRIVFAQCNESTTVVTVIDLDTEWTCDCPGDHSN